MPQWLAEDCAVGQLERCISCLGFQGFLASSQNLFLTQDDSIFQNISFCISGKYENAFRERECLLKTGQSKKSAFNRETLKRNEGGQKKKILLVNKCCHNISIIYPVLFTGLQCGSKLPL